MSNQKCESCQNGFNGRNGNGYQPCGCREIIVVGGRSKVNALVDALYSVLTNRKPPKKP